MNNMEDVTAALEDHQDQGGSSLTAFLLPRLQSPRVAEQAAAVETLHEYLFGGDEVEGHTTSEQRALILEDAALEFIPALLDAHAEDSRRVDDLLVFLAGISSPREVLFALEEALKGLADKVERYEVSDYGVSASASEEDELAEDDGRRIAGLLDQLNIIAQCLANVIPRLPLKKSTPTLLTISDILEDPLIMLLPFASPSQAAHLLESLIKLVEGLWDWSLTKSDTGGEQRSLCLSMLQLAISTCGARMEAQLLNRWFLATYPKYGKAKVGEDAEAADRALSLASDVFSKFNCTSGDLVVTMRQTQPQGPHAPIAALIILGHSLVSAEELPNDLASVLLEEIHQILVLAICDPTGGGLQDAGLTLAWAMWREQTKIDEDTASDLIEVLMPVAAGNRDPTSRLASFKLIGELVLRCESQEAKINCLQTLQEEANPYAQLRAESLVILRDVILASTETRRGDFFLAALEQIPDLHRPPAGIETIPAPEHLDSVECLFLTNLLSTLRILAETTVAGNKELERRLLDLHLEESLLRPAQSLVASLDRDDGEGIDSGGVLGAGEGYSEGLHQHFARERLKDELARLGVTLRSISARN